jgi:hypothetical protein
MHQEWYHSNIPMAPKKPQDQTLQLTLETFNQFMEDANSKLGGVES